MSQEAEDLAVSPEDEELLRRYDEAMAAKARGTLIEFSSMDEYRQLRASDS